jgi:hypothetical protein
MPMAWEFFELKLIAIGLILGEMRVSKSAKGSPLVITTVLDFAALHNIATQIEDFPMCFTKHVKKFGMDLEPDNANKSVASNSTIDSDLFG